ncbi:MAG: dickkopf-related protein [Pseudomonadota bacterium]
MSIRTGNLLLLAVFLAVFSGCADEKCTRDTDCVLPEICVNGACVLKDRPDVIMDAPFDLDMAGEDFITETFDPSIDVIAEFELDAADPDIADVSEEEPEEELPPATVLWEDHFTEGEVLRWESQQGDWEAAGGEYAQTALMFAESWVPAESWEAVAVEVSIVVDERDPPNPRSLMGVLLRVQGINPENKYYLCGLDYNKSELVLIKYNSEEPPGYFNLCAAEELSPAPAVGASYSLQAEARGARLTCRWVDAEGVAQAQIRVHDETYTAGSVGLLAHNAAGRFDDVIVYDHSPAQWGPAIRSESCE